MANRGENEHAEQKTAIENLKKDASQLAGGAEAVEGAAQLSRPKARNNGDDTIEESSLKGRAHDGKDFQRYLDGSDLQGR
jgi:hypothetical protein